jgi:predicted secreted protein with PEFG-CTERM motif
VAITLQKIFIITLIIVSTGIAINCPVSYSEVQKSATLSIKDRDVVSFESTNTADNDEKESEPIIVNSPSTKETTVYGLSSDGKIRVEIIASNPIANEPMTIDIKFRDSSGALKKFANYDILVTQNSKELLSAKNVHAEDGNGQHVTIPLDSEQQVDFLITMLGFGPKEDQSNWIGPRGEVLMFNVIPEFGTISMFILIVSMISSILIVVKTKNTIMLRK